MKAILVPTDFSKIARNAVDYAAEIAIRTKSKLILMHIYHVPVVSSEAPVILPVWEDIEKDCMLSLNKIKNSLQRKYDKELKIECIYQMGFAVDEIIKQYTEDRNIELIIMGMNGAGYLGEKLIGSNATELIRRSRCPILVINEKAKFRIIKKIVLGYDYQNIPDKSFFDLLKKFITLFKAQLFIVNVVKEVKKLPSVKKAANGVGIEHLLEGIDHSFLFIENEDMVAGINQFVADNKIDMIVFIPKKHSFFNSIFHESNTKRMAFHSTIPLLALHE